MPSGCIGTMELGFSCITNLHTSFLHRELYLTAIDVKMATAYWVATLVADFNLSFCSTSTFFLSRVKWCCQLDPNARETPVLLLPQPVLYVETKIRH